MSNPTPESVKSIASIQLKRLDVNGDGKIDIADARQIANDAVDEATAFTRANPLPGILIAFVLGVVLTLFLTSVIR